MPEQVLRAVALVESGTRPPARVINTNRDGSKDIGRMQINTSWLPTLRRYGITEEALHDECTSIHVGAWILANNVSTHGLSWEAIGAYNVGCRQLPADECARRRNRYAWKVYRAARPEAPAAMARSASSPVEPIPTIAAVTLQ